MTAPIALLASLFLAFGPGLRAPAVRTQDALARARAAVGSWREPGLRLAGRGTAHASGIDGELSLVFSAAGEFALAFDSRLPEASGFDGQTVWRRDRTGLVRVLRLEAADRSKLVQWVLSGHWLDSPEVVARPLAGAEANTLVLALAGTPLEMTLTLDEESGLPRALVQAADSGERRWVFADHRQVAGRTLAHRWSVNEGGNEERYQLATLDVVTPEGSPFRAPPAGPSDARFDADVPGELAVTRMTSGHLLVEPRLEGEDLGPFILDTGAGITVIDRRVADELFLETLGETLAVGVAGSTVSSYRRGESFQLGPLTITAPIYGDLDLGFLQGGAGRRVAGIVGHDVLARCVLELEPARARVVLHDPARYRLEGASWQELLLQEDLPCVRARFEGEREGLFRLDTGATGTVTFHAPAVTALRLLEGRKLLPGQSGGVGGSASAPVGTLAWFELAGQRFERPEVSFSQATSGAFTDRYTTGNLGQAFLKPFRIVLDLPHDRVAFVPVPAGG